MKKVIALAGAVVLALALAGCEECDQCGYNAQPMPAHHAVQSGHSSKLGKLGK